MGKRMKGVADQILQSLAAASAPMTAAELYEASDSAPDTTAIAQRCNYMLVKHWIVRSKPGNRFVYAITDAGRQKIGKAERGAQIAAENADQTEAIHKPTSETSALWRKGQQADPVDISPPATTATTAPNSPERVTKELVEKVQRDNRDSLPSGSEFLSTSGQDDAMLDRDRRYKVIGGGCRLGAPLAAEKVEPESDQQTSIRIAAGALYYWPGDYASIPKDFRMLLLRTLLPEKGSD